MRLSWSTLNIVVLCAGATLASCSRQSQIDSAQEEPPQVENKKRRATPRDASTPDDGAVLDAETRISTRAKELDAGADGGDASEPEPAKKPAKKSAEKPAEEQEKGSTDAGKAPQDKPKTSTTKTDPPKQKVDAECTRTRLREKAEAYLQSMTSGDTMPLRVHPSFRYTENGRDEQLGAGAWLRRSESLFSRHVLDESRCSTLTQAVMSGLTGRFSFAVRLLYSAGQLLEAEAQVVPELLASTDLDAVIPMGDDAFSAEVPKDERASREALFDFAKRYFDSVTGASTLPPAAADCRRLQNGLPLGEGTCTRPPGSTRFEQQRFDLADELNGIIAATVLYENHIGVYLLKISDNMLQNIEVIGGASSPATGW